MAQNSSMYFLPAVVFIFLLSKMRKVLVHFTNTLPYYTQCFKKAKILKKKV